jgi:D-alanyl-D-alanine carboxypeptidase/D-alanyl-D-alanine-endopeptidase (penicillin-binding protein 4)
MPGAPASPTSEEATAVRSPQPSYSLTGPLDLNPLVLAYGGSLQARGFDPADQGFIVSTMEGEILAEHNADRGFNPASVIKLATSMATLAKLRPDFRFRTSFYTDGALDASTGTLHGSLYVIGSSDPAFLYENALLVIDKLNRSGIRTIEGDLVVLGPFFFNFSASREVSARGLRVTLDPKKWTPAVKKAYPQFLSMKAAEERAAAQAGERPRTVAELGTEPPSLTVTGKTATNKFVDTSRLRLLAVHTSLPLVRLLKGLNDFSNNWMAHVIGGMVGGPDAVQRFLKTDVGLRDEELNIVTASGLGSNYISPRATLQIMHKLISYLEKEGLTIQELLPVAGVDAGTLEKRFDGMYRGSVVAKTGTLRGISALAGVAYTRRRGPLLFVIYNRGGSSYAFRSAQDETIKKLITFFGGPAPVSYSPTAGPRITERLPEAGGGLPSSKSPRQSRDGH